MQEDNISNTEDLQLIETKRIIKFSTIQTKEMTKRTNEGTVKKISYQTFEDRRYQIFHRSRIEVKRRNTRTTKTLLKILCKNQIKETM